MNALHHRHRPVFNRFLLAAIVSASVLTASCKRQAGTTAAPSVAPDLAAERAGFTTHLLRHGPSPESIESIDPTLHAPLDAAEIEYPSGGPSLKAWISLPPTDGKRHPAVVFLHGNFVFEMRQWTGTSAYRDAGFVVLTPMLRGENGNPGEFQMMYGEVDDVVAAGRYLASLPCVDGSRVFLAGHSVGGTSDAALALTDNFLVISELIATANAIRRSIEIFRQCP